MIALMPFNFDNQPEKKSKNVSSSSSSGYEFNDNNIFLFIKLTQLYT